MSKVNNPYNCDRQSKYDFTASTVTYIQDIYYNKDVEIVFKEIDKNGNLVILGNPYANTQSTTDLAMFINDIPYMVELKERWGKYHSTFYGKENDNEGWVLEKKKKEALFKAKEKGYIPLYVNIYPDGKVRIWNLNKIKLSDTKQKTAPKTTVVDSGKIEKDIYELWNIDSIEIEKVRGKASNGIWKNKRG